MYESLTSTPVAATIANTPTIEVAEAELPTSHGVARGLAFRSAPGGPEHFAAIWGDASDGDPVVRIHSECLTGDVLGSLRCDCGEQLQLATQLAAAAPFGIVIYMKGHEGRGIGIFEKMRAYGRQDQHGEDTVDANLALGHPIDGRDYADAALLLHWLGARRLKLITNNPEKVESLRHQGLVITGRVACVAPERSTSSAYIQAKRARLGHLL